MVCVLGIDVDAQSDVNIVSQCQLDIGRDRVERLAVFRADAPLIVNMTRPVERDL